MLSRTRRASRARATAAPSRDRFGLEPLESRTLLSSGGGSLALAMFNTSYVAGSAPGDGAADRPEGFRAAHNRDLNERRARRAR